MQLQTPYQNILEANYSVDLTAPNNPPPTYHSIQQSSCASASAFRI